REQLGGRRPLHQGNPHDAPTPSFDLVRADDRPARVVGSLDEHVGAKALDQRERRLLVEYHDTVHAGERREQSRPLPLGHEGTVGPLLQPSHRGVAVHAHDQGLALGARRFQQRHVPHMEEVEHPVREHDGTAHPLANFPRTAMARSVPPIASVSWLSGTNGFHTRGSTAAPMLRKKMGVKMSATGLMRSSIEANWFVSDRMSPAANAPMMSAVPARSARTQSSSRKANADTTRTPRTRMRSTRPKSRGASFKPTHRATKRNATATPRMRNAPRRLNAVPAASPETTPRITSPMTSSMTAAPRITRASRLCSTWRSLRTRAVIPTEVAVRVAPTKMAVVSGSATVCSYPCQPDRQY